MVMRASPHKREEKERVRSTLLRAALGLAAAHGFASLGLREVSRAAGIAPTSFYRHFADMGELGIALIREHVEPLLHELADCMVARDPSASAHCLAQRLLRAVEQEPEVVRFMLAERSGASPTLRASLNGSLDTLAVRLQMGAKRSVVAQVAADIVLALLLDGLTRALDVQPPERAALSTRWIAAMQHAWDKDAS